MTVTRLGLLGTGSATTAGTTIPVVNTTGAIIPAGTLVHLTGSWDNIASVTAPTVTCSTIGGATATANHATAIGSGVTTTAGAGIWHTCFRAVTTADIAVGGTIATLTSNQSAVKRAAHAAGFAGALATLRGTVTTATSTTGAPSVATTGTALVAGDLVIGSVSFENNAQMTADADTLNGSWSSPVVGTVTTGGGAATNVGTGTQAKIVTATGAQTFNPTGGVADTVACVYSVQPGQPIGAATGAITWAGSAVGENFGGANYYRAYAAASPPTAADSDSEPVSVGVEFSTSIASWVTAIHFWQATTGSPSISTRTVGIYRVSTGLLVGSTQALTPSGTGWQTATLTTPIPLLANTPYRAVVYHPGGHYAATAGYFATGGGATTLVNGILTVPNNATAVSNLQGTYNYASGISFPNSQFGGANYWTDVTVTDTDPATGGRTGTVTGAFTWAGTSVGDNGEISTGAHVLAQYAGASLISHTIPLSGVTAGRDVVVVCAVGATVTSGPGSPWTNAVTPYLFGGGTWGYICVWRLDKAANNGSITSLTVGLNAARKLSAVAWDDDVNWADSYLDVDSGLTPTAGGTLWGSGAHTIPARDVTFAVYAGGTNDQPARPINQTLTYDQGYTGFADSGASTSTTGSSPQDAPRVWVAQESPAGGFTDDGVVATFTPAAAWGDGTTGLISYNRIAPVGSLGHGTVTGAVTWVGQAGLYPRLTIAEENALPGNNGTEWSISGAGDSTVQGFARPFSANVGETMSFACNGTGTVLDIYRIGYYSNNTGWRKVTTLTNTATSQPNPVTIPNSNGAIECTNWSTTATWAIPGGLTSGLYCAVYRNAALNNASYIPFVVRDDARPADIIVKTSDATWALAYNAFGTAASPLTGKSWYGGGPGAFGDMEGRTFASTYEKPIVTRDGVAQTYWLACEAPMIRWLERMGYNLKYVSCRDIENNPSCLNGAKILLSSGHDEYWSQTMRDAFTARRDTGTNLMFASANEAFWRIRYDTGANRAWCHKDTMPGPSSHVAGTALDPVTWTGTWKDTRPANAATRAPENTLTGTDFRMNGVIDLNATLAAADAFAGHPVWRNTSIYPGGSGVTITATGVVGFEADSMLPTRPNATVLASELLNIDGRYADNNGENYDGSGNLNWGIVAQKYPSGAVVVGFGTCQWGWALDVTHDRAGGGVNLGIQQFTYNLFRDLGAAPVTPHTGIVTSSPASLREYGGPIGTATGAFTFVGTAAGQRTPKGSSTTGAFAFVGAAAGTRTPKATVAGQFTFVGAVVGSRTPKATVAGQFTFVGAVAGKRTPNGSSTTGAFALVGAAAGKRTPKATVAGAFAFVGAGVGKRTPRATVTGAFAFIGAGAGSRTPKATVVGALAFVGAAAGYSPVVGAKAGSASGAFAFVGAAAGKRTPKAPVTGGLSYVGAATGYSPIVGTETGSATGAISWVGTNTGKRTPKAAPVGLITWVGATAGVRASRGTGTGAISWAAVSVGKRVPKASSTGAVNYVGTATGKRLAKSIVTGTVRFAGSASGFAPAVGMKSGTVIGLITWVGRASGYSGGLRDLTVFVGAGHRYHLVVSSGEQLAASGGGTRHFSISTASGNQLTVGQGRT